MSLDGKESKLLFEDKLIEIHTFPLKHGIPTNGFLIKEKMKERKLLPEMIKGTGLKLEHLPKLKKGESVTDAHGKVYDYRDFTLPPKAGFSYAFCSDTAYWETIVPFIQYVSVLYHEATFSEKDRERAKAMNHSTASQAAKIAKMAGVGKLFLGHLSARYDDTLLHLTESQEIFPNTEVVEDGMSIVLSR